MGKKVAPAPLAVKKEVPKKVVNPLFEKKPRNFGIGKFLYCVKKLIVLNNLGYIIIRARHST